MPKKNLDRRGFFKKTVLKSVGSGFDLSLEEKILLAHNEDPAQTHADANPIELPQRKIGDVSISRLICGGNLIGGYAHSNDLIYVSDMLKNYFCEEKILDTWERCEENGINTVVTHFTNNREESRAAYLLDRYRRERGGKIQWIAQCFPDSEDVGEIVKKAVDVGASGCFLMGAIADKWTKNKRVDLIGKTVQAIQEQGVIAGVAGHSLHVAEECEREGVNPDYYVKTFHPPRHRGIALKDTEKDHHDSWCIDPEKTAEFMNAVNKPWIAYKVMAAGAIHPRKGLQYAFDNGADFVLAGMFDFQVAEDAAITREILSEVSVGYASL